MDVKQALLKEFPALEGKLSQDEALRQALQLVEPYGLFVHKIAPLRDAKHIFTHIEWRMSALAVEAGSPALPEGWVWADRAALAREYAVPNAFQPFQGAVEERLGHF